MLTRFLGFRNRAWFSGLVTLLLLPTSCTVGPNYHRPALNVPPRWSELSAGAETNSIAVITNWWKAFQDPMLDSLVSRAVRSNLTLRSAWARVVEVRAQRGVTAAGLWPSVNASASYSRNRLTGNYFLPLPPGTPLDYNLYQAGFDASWELDLFGGTRRALEAANAAIQGAEFNRRDVLVTLIAETARNYFEACGSQQRLEIARQSIAAQRDTLKLTRERFQAGVSSELDVHQAAALLAATEVEVPTIETALRTSVHRLGVLLGEPPGSLLPEFSTPHPLPLHVPPAPVGLPSDLLRRRPDIGRAERELAAATASIGVAVADLFPRFSLTGNAGLESVRASDWFAPRSATWAAGPMVTWRIFQAGRIRANIHVQTARQEQALANYEQTVLASFEDVENALSGYTQEQARHQSLELSVQAQRAALKLSQDLYRQGLADFLRVLESERALYQAEDALVQSQKAVSEDLIALYKAVGGGWETYEEGLRNSDDKNRNPKNGGR